VIAAVEQVRQEARISRQAVCRELAVAYSSVMRWIHRSKAGEVVIGKPGPAPTEPLNVAALQSEILQLSAGPHRTRGTGALYKRYERQISRRDFHALVEAARRELRQEERALERRVEWLVPGLVWSMDDADLGGFVLRQGHLHLVQDLGSHYKLRALGQEDLLDGWRVADSLAKLFVRRGAPVFLKRDNGPNLNHHAVNAVLDEFGVIPLNSPPYYPPYNGAIERAQQAMQGELEARIGKERVDSRVFPLECEGGCHELNHRRRRSLDWKTSCRVLEDSRPMVRQFGRRERKEAYEQIKELAVDIVELLDQHTGEAADTAFRYAAETWMQLNGLIRVSQKGEVLPCFHQIQSH